MWYGKCEVRLPQTNVDLHTKVPSSSLSYEGREREERRWVGEEVGEEVRVEVG
jgi:hypothetical protein